MSPKYTGDPGGPKSWEARKEAHGYQTYPMVRNSASGASGPDFGRIPIGPASKSALRPAERSKILSSPDQNPAEIRPGSPISGPEALVHNMDVTKLYKCIGFGAMDVTKPL